jgi:hypothetical protein
VDDKRGVDRIMGDSTYLQKEDVEPLQHRSRHTSDIV